MSTVLDRVRPDSTSTASAPTLADRFGRTLGFRLAMATFLGAFLLFQVQPLISKTLLPWYGGTPAVWTTALLFFQWLLVGGYAFAHGIARYAAPRTRSYAFMLVALVALFLLPIRPGVEWRPVADAGPIGHLLVLLLVSVGGPYFVLASTAPTTQEWFRRANPNGSPYRLYALSNAGSLLGLVTYPFLVERFLDLDMQSTVWSVLFATFVVVAASCAWSVRAKREPTEAGDGPSVQSGAVTRAAQVAEESPVSVAAAARWIALAAGGTTLLMSSTNLLCQDVAPVPFLWVAPLVVYLLTFIVCFEHPRWYRRPWYAAASAVLIPWAALQAVPFAALEKSKVWLAPSLLKLRDISFIAQATVVLAMLFVVCMLCHGELAVRKPAARHSTFYFLLVSLGGALGGLFTAVVAPTVFVRNWEWILATTAAMLLALAALGPSLRTVVKLEKSLFVTGSATAVFAGLALLSWIHSLSFNPNQIDADRNFYGIVSVDAGVDTVGDPLYVSMRSGSTFHGLQIVAEGFRRRPTAYFSEQSGVGMTLMEARKLGRPLRVGIIGLGVGTLAAYGRAGDVYDFYEINPVVVRFADEYFSFLRDSPAECRVVLGDARTSLERALGDRPAGDGADLRYDILVLDAFSGDSIPTHLLTAEAIDLYFKHLRDDGILAAHISNSHLDLGPVLAAAAEHGNLTAMQGSNRGNPAEFVQPARWALVTRRPTTELWTNLRKRGFGDLAKKSSVRLWTDDDNNLFEILR